MAAIVASCASLGRPPLGLIVGVPLLDRDVAVGRFGVWR
jgi:hypothetical protein